MAENGRMKLKQTTTKNVFLHFLSSTHQSGSSAGAISCMFAMLFKYFAC